MIAVAGYINYLQKRTGDYRRGEIFGCEKVCQILIIFGMIIFNECNKSSTV